MKKSRAAIFLALILIASCVLGYVAYFGIGSGHKGSYRNIKLGLDLAGGASITYEAVGDESPSQEDMDDTKYKLQKRVEQYSTEATVYQEGTDRLNIEIPGISGVAETNAILEELGRPGSLYFIRHKDADGNENYTLGTMEDGSYGYVLNKSLEDCIADGDAVLSGTDVETAEAGYQTDNMGNQQIVVSLTFTSEGKQKFADATTAAFNDNRDTIGIYYDGAFVSVPKVNAAITDGRAIIEGEETIESARTLASTIRIGGLKVELQRLRSQIVGAQLGQNALRTSKTAGIAGFALVALFMILVYSFPGFLSVIALGIYVILVALVLNGFDVTLTLPGIAGILLSIGMAVDANVIIFARIREDIAAGSSVRAAIKSGFQKALSAIIDGNVTTLIAAVVLYLLGSGTVKGFAQTLAIGIVLSMFTALFVTRALMNICYALGVQDKKWYGKGRTLSPIDFVGKRKVVFAVSAALIIAGFAFMGINAAGGRGALNYSLDFVGGTSTNVTFTEDKSLEDIDAQVVPIFQDLSGNSNVQVQKVTGSSEVIFKTVELSTEASTEISNRLVDEFGVDKDKITSETISSTISSEMKQDAMIAVVVALILMLIYIWLRFTDIRFGASAVVCLVHDVLIVLGGYALLRVSVGSTFIACMLTIVGYSINATIVVFDRIRENRQIMGRKDSLADMVNGAVTQTLSRSLFTSLTTFFMVATLWVFGVSDVKEFALPIMIGIISGAWSSVCIAGSLWYVLRNKFKAAEPAPNAPGSRINLPSKKNSVDYSGMSRKERTAARRKQKEESDRSKTVI
ncbi:MAG: protein translocase subunit SecD [Lachnospiraceae bacterium]|nr:protein translocase subunit SecD [Lachnospiraceae bacterium]